MAEKYMEVDLLKMAIEAEPFFTDSTKAAFRNVVNKVPAADAEKVVRCKNCHHADTIEHTLYCFHWERNTDEEGYCYEGC